MITVKTFGKFTIINGNKKVTEEEINSAQVIRLFITLALNRDKNRNREELKADLWEEGEIENTFGALKNLIYRARKKISQPAGAEFVVMEDNNYAWNNKLDVEFDFEKFDDYILSTINEKDDEIKYSKLEKAVELYDGDFLHEVKDGHWAMVLQSYYHKMYIWAVKSLIKHYKQQNDYKKIESLCDKAVTIELHDEQLYCDQIRAKLRLDKPVEALYSFKAARKKMEKQLGKGNAKLLNNVHRELDAINNGDDVSNIRKIQNEIAEAETNGVFFCDYQLFKEVCNLELRKSKRSDELHNLALLTIQLEKGVPEDTLKVRREKSMYGLEHTIRDCLRSGDVAAKYSDSQYILLLSQCTKDEARSVVNRVLESFYESFELFWKMNVKVEIGAINMDL